MLPAFLSTVRMPSATVHAAGDLSLTLTHWSRFLPSKSTIASDGGAALVAPGVTTFGTGSQTSVSSGLAWPACAAGCLAPACGAGVCAHTPGVSAAANVSVANDRSVCILDLWDGGCRTSVVTRRTARRLRAATSAGPA